VGVTWLRGHAESELRLALALTAKQNTAIGEGIILDPFNAAAAGQKLLDGLDAYSGPNLCTRLSRKHLFASAIIVASDKRRHVTDARDFGKINEEC
jgi:hypothetical protein